MFTSKLFVPVSYKKLITSRKAHSLPRSNNIQVSIVGAASEIGSNLAVLAKQNTKIHNLELYDEDEKVKGVALELNHIPGGPKVRAWPGDGNLDNAIRNSQLILMVYRVPRKPGETRAQMIAANAPAVQKLCRVIVDHNPDAFIGIATNPINSIIPFASALMYKYNSYNPFKVFGITHIDIARTRSLVANLLKNNPLEISVPVIGGHSEDTIVPLFSNMVPTKHLDLDKIQNLTQLLRKAGTEVLFRKHGYNTSTLAMAMSISDFLNLIVDAISGHEVTVNAFTANSNFGTRFFSGPTTVGPYGIVQSCQRFQLNDFETFLLKSSVPAINRDVGLGENYVQFIEMAKTK